MGRSDRTVGDYIDQMKQRPPRVRTRASVQLTLAEREEISRGLAEGHSIRSIASRMARSPSTVCREVARNGGRRRYPAVRAEDRLGRAVAAYPVTARPALSGSES
jgi:IS30 family transposase